MSGLITEFSSNAGELQGANGAGRFQLYDALGNPIAQTDRSANGITPGTTKGLPIVGADWKTGSLIRSLPDGAIPGKSPQLAFEDPCDGAAVNTNKWVQTTTTQTITQAAGAITFNASSLTTTNTGSMQNTLRRFAVQPRSGLGFRARCRKTAHATNVISEFGFGNPASAITAGFVDGAALRKLGDGTWKLYVSVGGTEVAGSQTLADATFTAKVGANANFTIDVDLYDQRASVRVYTAAGELFFSDTLEFGATLGSFTTSRISAFARTWNNGAAGLAEQIVLGGTSVHILGDSDVGLTNDIIMSEMGLSGIQSPVSAFGQLANYTNNAAPTDRTLSNTAAGETTLGGLISATAMATGAPTDLILFGWQNTTNYTFMLRGLKIPTPLNRVAAVATTATVFMYALGFDSTAISLATAGIKRVALSGVHVGAVALAANTPFIGPEVVFQPNTPIPIFPGRFFHIMCRCVLGTATATETFLWSIPVDGYFK